SAVAASRGDLSTSEKPYDDDVPAKGEPRARLAPSRGGGRGTVGRYRPPQYQLHIAEPAGDREPGTATRCGDDERKVIPCGPPGPPARATRTPRSGSRPRPGRTGPLRLHPGAAARVHARPGRWSGGHEPDRADHEPLGRLLGGAGPRRPHDLGPDDLVRDRLPPSQARH